MASGNQSGNRNLCPHCQQPLSPGVKFCESCGAKVEAPAPCPYCGDPLSPGVKFCETCGKAVPPAPAPGTATIPSPVPGPASPPEEPAKTAAPPPASLEPVPAEPAPKKAPEPEPEQASAPGGSPKTLIIAGVIGVVVIAALAWFVLLPMLSGAGMADSGNGAGPAGTTAALPDAAVSSPQTASLLSFDPQPVQRLPVNLEVTYQVERDPRNGMVTVTFSGGPGLNGIAETLIRVTRSDGQVLEESWKPARVGDSTTVQGTMLTDRVEVITNFYNGDSYRCFDEIFEYRKRN